MSANKRGLGKGLESLLSSTMSSAKKDAETVTASMDHNFKSPLVSGKSIISIDVTDIIPNPNQPRQMFDESTLSELAQSIKDHGIAQPILVRKRANHYELIAGERRWRAAKKLGIKHIPCIVKEMSDEESMEIALIENIQREDLNALDEAESYALLMEKFALSQEEAARKVGKARSSIANALRLLDLPSEIKQSLREGQITAGHARAILSTGNPEKQLALWKKIIKEKLNVRDSEKESSNTSQKKIKSGSSQKPSALIDAERDLSSKFSTKVVLNGSERKGKIEINYFSKDDLDRIYEELLS